MSLLYIEMTCSKNQYLFKDNKLVEIIKINDATKLSQLGISLKTMCDYNILPIETLLPLIKMKYL